MANKNWTQILSKAGCASKQATEWSDAFAKYCEEFKIDTPQRVAAFIANVCVESQYLRVLRENLRYSAKGLARTWPNRYSTTGTRAGQPNAKALSIAGNPVAIANHCYANRMGNGDEASGDGWKYSGKGPIQITGKSNTQAFFKGCGLPLTSDPNKLLEADMGVRSAAWFWSTNNINRFADSGDFDGCCDAVNIGRKTREKGDAHGYNMRLSVYNKLLPFLKSNPELLTKTTKEVLTEKEVQDTTPPEVTWIEQDPDSEYSFEHVEDYGRL